jgi:hypothetical protein
MLGQVNKLFIIGNGFDLAHGLKTKYNDFIRRSRYGLIPRSSAAAVDGMV